MKKEQKAGVISSLKEKLAQNNYVILVHYRGMNDSQLFSMRSSLKSSGCGAVQVVKNSLLKLASRMVLFEDGKKMLDGPKEDILNRLSGN